MWVGLCLAAGLCLCAIGLLAWWWQSSRLGTVTTPWLPYEVALPDGGKLSYRSQTHHVAYGFPTPADHTAHLTWTTADGTRQPFLVGSVGPEPDLEVRLRKDGQAAWLAAYGHGKPPRVHCCLDFTTGRFQDGLGGVLHVGQALEDQHMRVIEDLPEWAVVDAGRPLARWLRFYVGDVSLVLHWSPDVTETVLREERLSRGRTVLVVESPSEVWRHGEVRHNSRQVVVVDRSTSGQSRVRATLDLERGEFIDERLVV